jgi:enoyl-CoA hydratase/carnithine racemase
MDMMLTGKNIPAKKAKKLGILFYQVKFSMRLCLSIYFLTSGQITSILTAVIQKNFSLKTWLLAALYRELLNQMH